MNPEDEAGAGGRRRDLLVAGVSAAVAGSAGCAVAGGTQASGGGDASAGESALLVRGRELYRALRASDTPALRELLSADFQGDLTPGLPEGLGRRYDGLEAMMSEGWGPVGRLYAVKPEPERLIDGGDVLVGLGAYVGTGRATGRPMRAAFAHFWGWNGRQFTGVRQVTDSGAWRDALVG